MLCAECRVAICVKTDESLNGCLKWDKSIEMPDFVYHCPYCARKLNTISPVCAVWLLVDPVQLTPASSGSLIRVSCEIRGRFCSDMTHRS